MHNPLALLTTELLNALLAHGFNFFVRQSYPRGRDHFDSALKEAFLITPYVEIGEAQRHFDHISSDPRRHLYQIHLPEELEKLKIAASQPDGYKIYIDKLSAPRWRAPADMNSKIHRYLRTNTKWKAREGEIAVNLFLHYGELMLRLTNGREEIKINLSEIERL